MSKKNTKKRLMKQNCMICLLADINMSTFRHKKEQEKNMSTKRHKYVCV